MDRYGNRRYDASNTTTLGSCTEATCNPTISTSTNRFTSSGWQYDAAGNVTGDAEGKDFIYDAENHQIEVQNDQDTTIGEYRYDGDGKRVKKISSTETTIFVYNASGQLVAEYSTQTSQSPQTSYLTTDHLGSTRLVTDQLGAVKDRKDYGAFGDEIVTSARVSGIGYTSGGDEVRKGYTGYEKDGESGLEFAQARYYSTTHGRYTSVDPLTASASIRNPQTFNRYAYVLNSPYKYVDPLGLISSSTGACGQWCQGNDGGAVGWTQNYDSGQRSGREGSILDEYNRWQEYYADRPWLKILPWSSNTSLNDSQRVTLGRNTNNIIPCAAPSFSDNFGISDGDLSIFNRSGSEIQATVLTVFGEMSSVYGSGSYDEAFGIASTILNRSELVKSKQGIYKQFMANSENLVDIVSAGRQAGNNKSGQFHGYGQGYSDYFTWSQTPGSYDFDTGRRNCFRLFTAITAVRSALAAEPAGRTQALFFVAAYQGSSNSARTIKPTQFRIYRTDFSMNPISTR